MKKTFFLVVIFSFLLLSMLVENKKDDGKDGKDDGKDGKDDGKDGGDTCKKTCDIPEAPVIDGCPDSSDSSLKNGELRFASFSAKIRSHVNFNATTGKTTFTYTMGDWSDNFPYDPSEHPIERFAVQLHRGFEESDNGCYQPIIFDSRSIDQEIFDGWLDEWSPDSDSIGLNNPAPGSGVDSMIGEIIPINIDGVFTLPQVNSALSCEEGSGGWSVEHYILGFLTPGELKAIKGVQAIDQVTLFSKSGVFAARYYKNKEIQIESCDDGAPIADIDGDSSLFFFRWAGLEIDEESGEATAIYVKIVNDPTGTEYEVCAAEFIPCPDNWWNVIKNTANGDPNLKYYSENEYFETSQAIQMFAFSTSDRVLEITNQNPEAGFSYSYTIDGKGTEVAYSVEPAVAFIKDSGCVFLDNVPVPSCVQNAKCGVKGADYITESGKNYAYPGASFPGYGTGGVGGAGLDSYYDYYNYCDFRDPSNIKKVGKPALEEYQVYENQCFYGPGYSGDTPGGGLEWIYEVPAGGDVYDKNDYEIHMQFMLNPYFCDNTYGSGSYGWPSNKGSNERTMEKIIGSDGVAFIVSNEAGEDCFVYRQDQISCTDGEKDCPDGNEGSYFGQEVTLDCLFDDKDSEFGGWNKFGHTNRKYVTKITSSLAHNLNVCYPLIDPETGKVWETNHPNYRNTFLFLNSPLPTGDDFGVNTDWPLFEYRASYHTWFNVSAFEEDFGKFGGIRVEEIHCSPSKSSYGNSLFVSPSPCPSCSYNVGFSYECIPECRECDPCLCSDGYFPTGTVCDGCIEFSEQTCINNCKEEHGVDACTYNEELCICEPCDDDYVCGEYEWKTPCGQGTINPDDICDQTCYKCEKGGPCDSNCTDPEQYQTDANGDILYCEPCEPCVPDCKYPYNQPEDPSVSCECEICECLNETLANADPPISDEVFESLVCEVCGNNQRRADGCDNNSPNTWEGTLSGCSTLDRCKGCLPCEVPEKCKKTPNVEPCDDLCSHECCPCEEEETCTTCGDLERVDPTDICECIACTNEDCLTNYGVGYILNATATGLSCDDDPKKVCPCMCGGKVAIPRCTEKQNGELKYPYYDEETCDCYTCGEIDKFPNFQYCEYEGTHNIDAGEIVANCSDIWDKDTKELPDGWCNADVETIDDDQCGCTPCENNCCIPLYDCSDEVGDNWINCDPDDKCGANADDCCCDVDGFSCKCWENKNTLDCICEDCPLIQIENNETLTDEEKATAKQEWCVDKHGDGDYDIVNCNDCPGASNKCCCKKCTHEETCKTCKPNNPANAEYWQVDPNDACECDQCSCPPGQHLPTGASPACGVCPDCVCDECECWEDLIESNCTCVTKEFFTWNQTQRDQWCIDENGASWSSPWDGTLPISEDNQGFCVPCTNCTDCCPYTLPGMTEADLPANCLNDESTLSECDTGFTWNATQCKCSPCEFRITYDTDEKRDAYCRSLNEDKHYDASECFCDCVPCSLDAAEQKAYCAQKTLESYDLENGPIYYTAFEDPTEDPCNCDLCEFSHPDNCTYPYELPEPTAEEPCPECKCILNNQTGQDYCDDNSTHPIYPKDGSCDCVKCSDPRALALDDAATGYWACTGGNDEANSDYPSCNDLPDGLSECNVDTHIIGEDDCSCKCDNVIDCGDNCFVPYDVCGTLDISQDCYCPYNATHNTCEDYEIFNETTCCCDVCELREIFFSDNGAEKARQWCVEQNDPEDRNQWNIDLNDPTRCSCKNCTCTPEEGVTQYAEDDEGNIDYCDCVPCTPAKQCTTPFEVVEGYEGKRCQKCKQCKCLDGKQSYFEDWYDDWELDGYENWRQCNTCPFGYEVDEDLGTEIWINVTLPDGIDAPDGFVTGSGNTVLIPNPCDNPCRKCIKEDTVCNKEDGERGPFCFPQDLETVLNDDSLDTSSLFNNNDKRALPTIPENQGECNCTCLPCKLECTDGFNYTVWNDDGTPNQCYPCEKCVWPEDKECDATQNKTIPDCYGDERYQECCTHECIECDPEEQLEKCNPDKTQEFPHPDNTCECANCYEWRTNGWELEYNAKWPGVLEECEPNTQWDISGVNPCYCHNCPCLNVTSIYNKYFDIDLDNCDKCPFGMQPAGYYTNVTVADVFYEYLPNRCLGCEECIPNECNGEAQLPNPDPCNQTCINCPEPDCTGKFPVPTSQWCEEGAENLCTECNSTTMAEYNVICVYYNETSGENVTAPYDENIHKIVPNTDGSGCACTWCDECELEGWRKLDGPCSDCIKCEPNCTFGYILDEDANPCAPLDEICHPCEVKTDEICNQENEPVTIESFEFTWLVDPNDNCSCVLCVNPDICFPDDDDDECPTDYQTSHCGTSREAELPEHCPCGCDCEEGRDACGICCGDNSTCSDCDGKIGGKVQVDSCGYICGNNDKCPQPYCDDNDRCGVCVDEIDVCGVCGGNSSTCYGCDYVPASGKEYDDCGVCDGNNDTCWGDDDDGAILALAVVAAVIGGGSAIIAAGILFRIQKRPDLLTGEWDALIDQTVDLLNENPLALDQMDAQNPLFEVFGEDLADLAGDDGILNGDDVLDALQ